jgi:hypothetical protein
MLRDVDPNYRGDVQRALTLLCCAKRPLLVEELVQAIAVELGDPPKYNAERQLKSSEDLQQICAGFIDIDVRFADGYGPGMEELNVFSIPDTRYEMVRIAHFSVQEFLRSDRIQTSKDLQDLVNFHVNMQDANDQMAGTCLTFLLEPSILEPMDSTSSPLASMALEHYAARYWIDHFNEYTSSPSTRAQAVRLFHGEGGVFENWISRWNHDGGSRTRPAPLYYASLLGLRSIVCALINIGLSKRLSVLNDLYSRAGSFFLNEETGYYRTALQAASVQGHLAIAQMLIEAGADISQESGDYGTALQAAAIQGHLDIVQLLIMGGADINQQAGHYGTALQAASTYGHLKIVELLIRKGANITQEGGDYGTALQAASRCGYIEIVQLLLREGANVNQEAGHNRTALRTCISIRPS